MTNFMNFKLQNYRTTELQNYRTFKANSIPDQTSSDYTNCPLYPSGM